MTLSYQLDMTVLQLCLAPISVYLTLLVQRVIVPQMMVMRYLSLSRASCKGTCGSIAPTMESKNLSLSDFQEGV